MTRQSGRFPLGALLPACACLAAWLAVLCRFHPGLVADEQYHFAAACTLARGDALDPEFLGMPATYHRLAAALIGILGPKLWVMRALNTTISAVTLMFVASAAGALRGRWPAAQSAAPRTVESASPGLLLWVLALNPLIFPYAALAYTEPAALLAVLAAFWCVVARKPIVAAVLVVAACLVRQSNLAWGPFFAIWWLLDRSPGGDGASTLSAGINSAELTATGGAQTMPTQRPSAWHPADWNMPAQKHPAWHPKFMLRGAWGSGPLWLASPVGWLLLQMMGGVEQGGRGGNAAQFNEAQGFVFALALATFWLPLWLARLPDDWRRIERPFALQGRWLAAGVGLVGLIAMLYHNRHPWNADPEYLRNWALIAMDWSEAARYVFAAIFVAVALLLTAALHRQTPRRFAVLVVLFAVAFLAPHYLVDPRYYQIPLALITLTIQMRRGEAVALIAWQGVITVAIGGFILVRGSPQGGIW